MEKLAVSISKFIAAKLNYEKDKQEVIAYGLTAIFQMVSIFVIASVIGLIGNFWAESTIIFLAVGILRKSTGGAHSQTMKGCLIISIFSISFLGFLAKYLFDIHLINHLYFLIPLSIIYLFSFFFIHKLAPVASPKKPITREEKRKMLRKKSFITWFVYYAISVGLVFFSNYNINYITLSISLSFATLWQAFTLTKFGHKTIDIIDFKFRINN